MMHDDEEYVATPGQAPVNPTSFNPFAALGLQPNTATVGMLRAAYRSAMRHRHESIILRYPATTLNFPSQSEVQQAYDYLSAPSQLGRARSEWAANHRDVFFPQLQVGDPGVFGPAAATTATAPEWMNHIGNGSSNMPRRPYPARRAFAAGPGSSPDNPIEIDDDDDDKEDDDHDDRGTRSTHPSNPFCYARRRRTYHRHYHPYHGAAAPGPSSNRRPREARRTAATGPGSSPHCPIVVEEEEEEEEELL
jgi:hypothetical protein